MDEGSTFCSARNWWRGIWEEKEREKNKYRKTNYGHTILIVFVSVGSWLDDS